MQKSRHLIGIWVILVFALPCSYAFLNIQLAGKAHAASANITLVQNAATIEVDTNQAVATFGLSMSGSVVNGGSNKVFIHVSGGTVATTDAQAQLVVGLPPGASMPILRTQTSFTYKTAANTSVLYWFPNE